ncbi:motile sperm domain-containing protein 2-like isoform X2 [Ornithodoros turicata]|uniref:motile sperm domain-containing protein 2-like isoform X2 n=1 Tax=Ornithodoros turicata TaxID=34597 RepID=UPI0031386FED
MYLQRSGDSMPVEDSFVKIEPEFELVFGENELEGGKRMKVVDITNTSSGHVTFKIKTNNIDGYKVKPFFGIIHAGNTVHVNVEQIYGTVLTPSDKLLVMTACIDAMDMSPKELVEHWKTVTKDNMKEHRLRLTNHTDSLSKHEVNEKEHINFRSVGSVLSKGKTAKDEAKVESSVSFAPIRQQLSISKSQLDEIEESLTEIHIRRAFY